MGPVAAVVAETPFLVAFYWFAWAAVLRRSCSGFKPAARLAISISWLALLIAAEIGLGMLLRGFSLEYIIASYGTSKGRVGLVAPILCAAFPLLRY
jgi:hypothetical protein